MPLQDIIFRMTIAVLLGALLGAQRELRGLKRAKHDVENFGGIRTYGLFALFGSIASYMYLETGEIWVILVTFIVASTLVVGSYLNNLHHDDDRDLLSELAAMVSFMVGAMCLLGPLQVPVIIGIAIPAILALKQGIHKVLHHVTQQVFMDALKFAIVAFVILPLLPNEAIDPWGIVNPFKVWFFVVMVSAISFSGYIVSKIVGAGRGIIITGLIGGLASSTGVTLHLSHLSKQIKGKTVALTSGIILASFVMFLRLELLILVLSPTLALAMLKCFVPMAVTAGGVLLWLRYKEKNGTHPKQPVTDMEIESSFRLLPAIKFGGFFIFIQLIGYISNYFFGEAGVYLFSGAAGLADVDSPTYILTNQFLDSTLAIGIASQAIIIVAVSNTIVKGIIPLVVGRRDVGIRVLATFLPMAVIGLISAFLFA